MTEEEVRRLLLVRAVESEDGAEALMTREDRQQATQAGLAGPAPGGRARGAGRLDPSDEAFLVRRSEFAFSRLNTRFPPVQRADRAARWPRWLDWLIPLGAFVLGVVTNELGGGNRLNIIAFPLVGMIAWNLLIYVALAAGTLRSALTRNREPSAAGGLTRLFQRMVGPRGGSDGQPIGRALSRFSSDWIHFAGGLQQSRARRALHLAAAALAAGLLVGMYGRALSIEYRAGWESTFVGAGTLHAWLAFILAPATALTGIGLPNPAGLEALRWSNGPGQIAGPWIHLYAATAFLFIIGPRLLLAALAAARVSHLRRRMPAPGLDDFYVRRLIRSARGGGATVRIIPYSYRPDSEAQRRLQDSLVRALGEGTQTSFDPPITYGGEDEWLDRATIEEEVDYLIILFNLSATPEDENHGALAAGLQRRLTHRRSGARLAAILDQTPYRQRLGTQADADQRLRTRTAEWERVLSAHHLHPLAVDLGDQDVSALAKRLESALVKDAALVPQAGAR
ncbi:MAG TPA: DUF2868 domain-containing protein [Allosphingosinicella sp.]|nr:DUF2868 domain-containing protein [Allosphingosinicella sp.]